MGKQRKGEKCPDTGGTRTRDSGSGGSSLNHQTTSAPMCIWNAAERTVVSAIAVIRNFIIKHCVI